jgi:predicted nucleotidyltransferase
MTDMLDRRGEPPVTAPILSGMATQLDDALSTAALNETERRVVERLVARLRSELGADLLAVWLYGSRARGEADPAETDPDRRSDVDLLAIAAGGDERYGNAVNSLRFDVAESLGDRPFFFSVKVMNPEWLRGRREIDSFFIQEVDRDKLILYGDALERYGGGGEKE